MELPVYNMAGEQVSTFELPATIFEATVNRALMHQALVRQLANARLGTHKAKTRSEVNRTTAKVYRQKGTGRARHGSRKAPIFVGGGKAHGPVPHKYTKNMPRKMRRAALCSALSVKADQGDIVLLDQISMDVPKTKNMADMMKTLTQGETVLLLLADRNEMVEKSARNLTDVKTLRANYLNIRDLLGYSKIVMPLAALDVVSSFLEQDMDDEWIDAEDAAVEGNMHWRDIIRRPVVTEKSNFLADVNNQYTFVVHPRANKMQVKQAIELAWPNVRVEKIRIANMPAKRARRLRRITVRKAGWKKAVVTLQPGGRIDLFEGV